MLCNIKVAALDLDIHDDSFRICSQCGVEESVAVCGVAAATLMVSCPRTLVND